ncbi:hypothetical protein ACIRYZ_10850, partial [Kitasatospora sp. NPDC101155]|uniref:hypothetical protein n=1 Tax=Kitasatospora sp. NPDC101155 TaxID=3364097 RepID=UPI0038179CA7
WRLGRLRREPTVQGALMRQAFGQFQYPTPPLRRLDMTRVYREAYDGAGLPGDRDAAGREAAAEFDDEDDEDEI